MSLLTMVQNAMTLAGLPVPSSVFSSTNNTVEQFVRLVYVVGGGLPEASRLERGTALLWKA